MTCSDQQRQRNEEIEDKPVVMMEYEDIKDGMQSKHDRAELHDINRYRRKRCITKIFRDTNYSPKLDDIEELDENSTESEDYKDLMNNAALSLNSLHKERMRNHKGSPRVKRRATKLK